VPIATEQPAWAADELRQRGTEVVPFGGSRQWKAGRPDGGDRRWSSDAPGHRRIMAQLEGRGWGAPPQHHADDRSSDCRSLAFARLLHRGPQPSGRGDLRQPSRRNTAHGLVGAACVGSGQASPLAPNRRTHCTPSAGSSERRPSAACSCRRGSPYPAVGCRHASVVSRCRCAPAFVGAPGVHTDSI
jgi:hypothetical protein